MPKELKPVPVTLVSDKREEPEEFEGAPLFTAAPDDKTIAHVLVIRTDPDEGTLGTMPPNITELAIKRRWGGGTFQLQGRDERNRMIKGAFRTITIAGDPLFESKAAQAKWRRQQQIDGDDRPAAATDAIGLKDVIALLSSTEQKTAAAAALRLEEQERQHKRELERLRLEAEIKAAERKAEEERRERAQEEREERRRREDEERDERRRKDDEAQRHRDREFQVMLAGLTKKGGSDADMLLKGLALGRDLNPGPGDGDPVAAVATALLPTLLGPKPAANPAPAPAAAAAQDVSDDAVTFDGDFGRKTARVVHHLRSQGYDPEAMINRLWDTLLQAKRNPELATAPAPPAPVPPPSKATTPTKRRTTKK